MIVAAEVAGYAHPKRCVDGAVLDIEVSEDFDDPHAQHVRLESVDFDDPNAESAPSERTFGP